MSERYSRLFTLPENLYSIGSPVVIAAGALLKDNQTGKVIAQLKLRNIGNKAIKTATVSVIPFDTVGNPLGDPIQYQYLDLNTQRDNDFGSKSAISLPDITTRSFVATVTEIAFVDNSVWAVTESPWEPLSVPATISSIHGTEFAKQFCMEYGAGCKNIPLSEKDLWHCTCGALNHNEESHCHSCRKAFAAISSYNVDELNTKKNKRLADEKAKAEYEAEQARIKAEKNAKKAKKLAIIAACAVAVLLLITKVIIPGLKYSKADKLVEAGQYTEAIKAYKAIDDTEKTKERIAAAYYTYGEELLAEEQFDKAVTQFQNAGDYKDAKDRVGATYYTYAEKLLAEEQFDKSVTQFQNAGDYKDAKDRIDETYYAYAEALLNNGNFDKAIIQFEALGNYKDAADRILPAKYAKAESLVSEHQRYEAYLAFKKLGDYSDAKDRATQLKNELQQALTIQLVYFNTDRNDTSTIATSISKKDRFLHYGFLVEGLYPGETIELINTYTWPGKQRKLATWTWGDVKSGEVAECLWDNGYETSNNGELKVNIHIFDYQQNVSEAGTSIGSISMKVQQQANKKSSGYGVGGASNSEHN